MATTGRPLNTIQISEREIAVLGLGYLRTYYKYRPRIGEPKTRQKVEGEGGIIADGYLSFRVNEEQTFVATLEATDFWHREELRFRKLRDLLLIDALTISSLLSLTLLAWFYFRGKMEVLGPDPISIIPVLLLLIAGFTGVMLLLLRPFRRYRYIYAVEQFKQYHADDQWICFAWDVFPHAENKFFKELRLQCIRYGLGLLEVDQKKQVNVHLTPARSDDLLQETDLPGLKQLGSFSESLQQSVGRVLSGTRPADYPSWQRSLLRFRRTYYNQLAIISTCLLLTGAILYEYQLDQPIRYVDEAEYERRQRELRPSLEEEKKNEIFYFKIDSGIFVRASDHYLTPYIVFDPAQEPIPLVPPEKSVVSVYEAGAFRDLPCEKYLPISRGRYMIFFASFYNQDEAKRTAFRLRQRGIEANVGWAECFFYANPFYLVFLEGFFTDLELTQNTVRRLAGELQEKGLRYEVGLSQMTR